MYANGEPVVAWLNKIGPYHNPIETYSYYDLPYCAPETRLSPHTKFAGLGEVFEGTEHVNSDLDIRFRQPVPTKAYCHLTLSDAEAAYFKYAVENHYWYQMYVDDLPVWGMVGGRLADHTHSVASVGAVAKGLDGLKGKAGTSYVYTHRAFSLGFNEDRVVEVNLTTEAPVEVAPGASFDLTYSVQWVQSGANFESRFRRYLDHNFFEHHIHWFSLFNSFMMVVFLVGLVSLILLRTLRNDYARYMADEDGDVEGLAGVASSMGEDVGWKQVHGDVFRRPPHLPLLSALVGTGFQFVLLVAATLGLALVGSLHWYERGTLSPIVIAVYALTSAVAGYVSAVMYRAYYYPEPSPAWIRVMMLTATLAPGTVLGLLVCLNFVSIYYQTINTIPLGMLVALIGAWALVNVPLVAVGTIVGRRMVGEGSEPPTRVNAVPRPIPKARSPWAHPVLLCLLGGLLPFGAIFIELYFVYVSFWNYKFYYVYGFMLLVFGILLVVTCCVAIVTTYYFLNAEDWRWPWLSFLSSSSVSLYIGGYSVYYFLFKTSMTGLLQTAYYMAYSGLFALVVGLMMGTIGYMSARLFVRAIFSQIKAD